MAKGRIVSYTDPTAPASEAFRALRTNLQFLGLSEPVATIAVTGAGAREGKSTTASNLAISIAQAGRTCVLVDADLRCPVIHQILHTQSRPGLSDVLGGLATVDQALHDTWVPGLKVMPAGELPPSPADLLLSPKMAELIAQLKTMVDMVVIDTPPIGLVSDAATLARVVDGYLLVLGAGRTSKDMARQAKRALETVNANILGVVLNNMNAQPEYRYGYANYGHYGQHGRERSHGRPSH
ncbi:MAG TPA: CpsD/CapB family tyrosine-protein kinase [Bacillota bacterium]